METFHERFNNGDVAKGVLSISSPRKPQWRLFLIDSTHRSRRRKAEGCLRFWALENPTGEFYWAAVAKGKSKTMFSISSPRKPRHNNSDNEAEIQNDASAVAPKNATLRLSLSDSTTSTVRTKCRTMFSISSPRKPHSRFSPRKSARIQQEEALSLCLLCFCLLVTDYSSCNI